LRTPDEEVSITYREYAERVRRIAGGLASLRVGRGDTVALMLTNRPEFNLVDTAAIHLGATPFSIYNTSPPEQISYLLGNAGSRVVVTERAFLRQVRGALAAGELAVERIVLVDGEDDGTLPLGELERAEPSGFNFEASWRAVEPSDILTLLYTSGTTGPPKGVQLTHTNMVAENRGTHDRLPSNPGGRITSFLPSAHIADRWSAHYLASITLGHTVPRSPIHGPSSRTCPWSARPSSARCRGSGRS
jgi:long-subunit acyl-CoA synthetase (AMP-forming)